MSLGSLLLQAFSGFDFGVDEGSMKKIGRRIEGRSQWRIERHFCKLFMLCFKPLLFYFFSFFSPFSLLSFLSVFSHNYNTKTLIIYYSPLQFYTLLFPSLYLFNFVDFTLFSFFNKKQKQNCNNCRRSLYKYSIWWL